MSLDSNWFTERNDDSGIAFSLKVEEKLADEQTPFQKIEVFRTAGFGNLMAIDGFIMLSTRDNYLYHEMMSHPVLYTHPDPKRVVIIGGGDCGTLREVLRHPEVQHATQVEIDERVTRLSERHFPELCESNNDSRAELLFDDGIKYIADAVPGSIDVIIIDSTDPIGPAEGLFGEPFLRTALTALGEDGILVQQSESPLLHMKLLDELYAAMRGAGFGGVQSLFFPQAVYPSGWWSATMATRKSQFPEADFARIEARPFESVYYNAEIHKAAFAQPTFFKQQLGG